MRGKLNVAFLLLTVISLLSSIAFGGVALAAPVEQPAFSGFGEIRGPLHLTVSISPPVSSPRDKITLELQLTNRLQRAATPEIIINLPTNLSSSLGRFPPATSFNYQENRLSWQPVVSANGGQEQMSLTFTASVANVKQPEQAVNIYLRHAEQESRTSVSFWVGLPPTATIAVNPNVAAVGQPIQLQAQTSGPGPFTQTWELGDGRTVSAKDPTVVYGIPGIYEIKLQVANPLGVATALSAITIVSQPTAAFHTDDERPVVGQEIGFINESGGERPLTYHWSFGDGATSDEASPKHRYAAPGNYVVELVVGSQHGRAETSLPISVGIGPTTDFVFPEQAATGQPLSGQAFGDDTVTKFRWNMGDGVTYEGNAVSHTYQRVGDFQITVTASNEYGDTSVTRVVHVEPGMFALFLPTMLRQATGGTVNPVTQPAAPPAAAPATTPALVTPQAPAGSDSGLGVEALPTPVPPLTGSNPAPATEPFTPVTLPPQAALAENASPPEQLLWYINEARRLHGLPPLSYNYELSIAAQHHTYDMSKNPDLMHIGSDGSRPAERQQRFGYTGAYAGEAVAWGFDHAAPTVEFWVNSPPHRALLLNPNATEVGVGFVADGTAPNLWYWTAEFGIRLETAPQIAPF